MIRILIADDHAVVAEGLKQLIEAQADMQVVAIAGDGREAVREAGEFEPDLVLIDIGMPKLSGYDVARHIRERYGKDRPVLVALTGWKQASDRILATLAGFHHHVAKPYDPGALLALIRRFDKPV
ncbi:hypothetical protein AYO46_10415 [Betaproteobacteria bacterium SCGC AG-212-J23]|nr:hypothetical protein AYO46_10415 [Betaproteobacteria bacterium SCGC AG-212-J23]